MPNSEENITYFCWHTILCSSINRHFRGQICGLQNFTHLRYIIYTFTVIYFCYEFIVIFHTCSFLEFVTLQPDGHLSHVHRLTPFTNTHASSKKDLLLTATDCQCHCYTSFSFQLFCCFYLSSYFILLRSCTNNKFG